MRRLAIAILSFGLATAAGTEAQACFGGQKTPPRTGHFGGSGGSPPAARPTPDYGVPAPQPYKPHAAPAAPKSPGVTDGGEGFKPYEPYKPFKGGSVYSEPTKPAKPKSLFDR